MDSKDIELKSALDEIFGDDIIELDENTPVTDKKELTNEELFENTSTLVFNEDDIISAYKELNSIQENNINNNEESTMVDKPLGDIGISNTFDIPVIESNEDSNVALEEIKPPVIEEDNYIENNITEFNNNIITEVVGETKDNLDVKSSNIPIKKVVIISIIVILITLAGVYLIINYNSNRKKVVNCSYIFDDKNYKITDEYKITYKNKKITYVEGVYIYSSKTNEYNSQIKYIKEDKLPAIINSNGMKGFTYTYENTDDSIKISSYLDYTIMDEDEINAIDQKIKPISYFKIDLNENDKNLIETFEKQGYKCIRSK